VPPLLWTVRTKTLLSVIIPFVIVLILVAVIGNLMFEYNSQAAVEQRDTEIATLTAARLSEGLSQYSGILQRVAVTDDIRSMDPVRAQEALMRAGADNQFMVFDAGVVLYDRSGNPLAAEPAQAAAGGFPDPGVLSRVNSTLRPAYSNVFPDSRSGNDVFLIAVPVLDRDNDMEGVLAGFCTVKYSLIGSMFVNVLEFHGGGSGYAYLVDGNGTLIYHRYLSAMGGGLAGTEPVQRVIRGETGAVVTQDTPNEGPVISAFAPVPGTDWGVVTHEDWNAAFAPVRFYSYGVLLLIIVGGNLSVLLIYFQVTQILKPIQDLTRGAQRIGNGDFTPMKIPESGDEIQTLAVQFNAMAGALKDSFSELKQRMDDLKKIKDEIQTAYDHLAATENELRTNYEELSRSQQALQHARKKLNLLQTLTFQDIQNALFTLEGYLDLHGRLPQNEPPGAFVQKEKEIMKKISGTLATARKYQDLGMKPPLWQNAHQVFLYAISHLNISGMSRNVSLGNLELFADPLLETVFYNLVDNVIHHGKSATELRVYYQETAGGLTLFFEDNGVGIPDENKEKIFDREYSSHRSMGLFLSREILSITNISIRETGTFGKGARFEIVVPREAYRFADRAT
jgi:signal transduction histidine kinase